MEKLNIPKYSEILLEYWYGKEWEEIDISEPNDDIDMYVKPKKKKSSLSYLLNFVSSKGREIVVPIDNKAKYTFPENQIEWMDKNDYIYNL